MKNNILIDNKIINNEELSLESKIREIIVEGNFTLNLFNPDLNNLKVLVKEDSKLIINYFNNKNDNTKIKIEMLNNSSFVLNHSFICNKNYDLQITSNYLSNNSNIDINICGLNDQGTSTIDINGNVDNNRINNVLNESVKVININDGKTIIMPKMYISENDVIANHSVTIGKINDEELFYLMSKGINKLESIKLICNGLLLSKMNNVLKEKMQKIIGGE